MTRIADGKWTEVRSAASIEAHQRRSRAKGRALQRLKKAHEVEFAQLLSEELSANRLDNELNPGIE